MIAAAIVELSSGARTGIWWAGALAGAVASCRVLVGAYRRLRTTRPALWLQRRLVTPIAAARQAERDARTLEAHRQLLAPIAHQLAEMRTENAVQHENVWQAIDGMSGRLTAVEEALTAPERRIA